MGDRRGVALTRVTSAVQVGFLARGRERAEAVQTDELEGSAPLARRESHLRQPAAELERGEHVAFEIEVAGDVRPTETELTRRGDDPADGVGRLHQDLRRRMLGPAATAVVGLEGHGQVGPDDLLDEVGDGHGDHPTSELDVIQRPCSRS